VQRLNSFDMQRIVFLTGLLSPATNYLFSRHPQRPSYWEYEIDYRGRGGSLDKWQVHYDSFEEQFEAKLTRITDGP
jgi:hypothetical protein